MEQGNVHIKDQEHVTNLIKRITDGGRDRLQVILNLINQLSVCHSFYKYNHSHGRLVYIVR